jgi:hypothetical protein
MVGDSPSVASEGILPSVGKAPERANHPVGGWKGGPVPDRGTRFFPRLLTPTACLTDGDTNGCKAFITHQNQEENMHRNISRIEKRIFKSDRMTEIKIRDRVSQRIHGIKPPGRGDSGMAEERG